MEGGGHLFNSSLPGWGGGHGVRPPSYDFFRNLPIKFDVSPHVVHPPSKNEAPLSEKQPPQLKREAPFHEMIPRKSK